MKTAPALRALRSRDARFDGLFYYGVTTTRIFCRPSCPATPANEEHIRLFPTAVAAISAGFRSCKRCRPASSAGAPEWRIGHDLARRAVRLIADGAIDDEGVGALARSLGYSERQIHRHLVAEIGASALAVARTRRANAARVLLESTSLPNAEIAYAAGFRSLRQYHETLRAVFDRTPTEIRSASVALTRTDGALVVDLAYREPLALGALFEALSEDAAFGVARYDGSSYRRALALPRATGVIIIGRGRPGSLSCELLLDDLRDLPVAISRVRRFLDLDADALAIATDLRMDPSLAPIVDSFPGMRILGSIDALETICVLVLRSTDIAGPLGSIRALCVPTDSESFMAFPSIEQIRRVELRRTDLAPARALLLGKVFDLITSGNLDLSIGADVVEATAVLTSIPGMPDSVVREVRKRIFSDPDVTDLGIGSSAHRWSPWGSYAVEYQRLDRRRKHPQCEGVPQ